MGHWTRKHIEELMSAGKIPRVNIPERKKNYSEDREIKLPQKKAKGLIWLEWNLQYWCNEKALTMEREHKFCSDRGWRFDFAIPSLKIAVEYEGGIFLQTSGHNTAKHYTKDTEKYNRATVLGWRVIRVTALNYTTALNQLNAINND